MKTKNRLLDVYGLKEQYPLNIVKINKDNVCLQ